MTPASAVRPREETRLDAASDGPAGVVRAFMHASLVEKDEAAVRALLTRESLEDGSFAPPADADRLRVEFGEAREEAGEWLVPVTVTNPDDPARTPTTMPFALVVEDGRWKIDMGRTMERLLRGSA